MVDLNKINLIKSEVIELYNQVMCKGFINSIIFLSALLSISIFDFSETTVNVICVIVVALTWFFSYLENKQIDDRIRKIVKIIIK